MFSATMAEDKDATSVPLSQSAREDEEGRDPEDPLKSTSTSPDSSTRNVSQQYFSSLTSIFRNVYEYEVVDVDSVFDYVTNIS